MLAMLCSSLPVARNPLRLEFVNAEKSRENRSALVMNAGIQLVCWCLDCSSGLQGLQGLLCAHLQICQSYASLQTTKKSSR